MSEQEKMDDLIRSKFSEMDFPFNEENWAKAEEMIVAARKKEKRRRWGIIFFFGILIGVLVMIPFVLKNSDAEKSNTTLAENKNTTVESNTENKGNQTVTTAETKPEEKMVKTEEATEGAKSESIKENTATKEPQQTQKEEKSSPSPIVTEDKSVPIKTKKPIKPTLPVSTTISAAPVSENGAETIKPTKKETKTTESPVKVTAVKEQKQNPDVVIPSTKKKESEPKQETKKEVLPVVTTVPETKKKEEVVKQETKKDVSPVTTKSDEIKNNSAGTITPLPVASIDSVKQQPIVTKKDSIASVTPVVKKDTLPVVAKQVETKKDSLIKTKRPWILSAEAGVNSLDVIGLKFSPIAGLNISKPFSPHFEIGSGIYYTYLSLNEGTNIDPATSFSTFTTSVNYDFGYSYKGTDIKTSKLHYIFAPLFAKFNFNSKNSIVVGANFFYLFNSSNTVTTFERSYAGIHNVISKKANGYYNGFNTYDVGIMLGYKRNLYKKLGVALYVNYGLYPLYKYIKANVQSNNASVQLVLSYKLLK